MLVFYIGSDIISLKRMITNLTGYLSVIFVEFKYLIDFPAHKQRRPVIFNKYRVSRRFASRHVSSISSENASLEMLQ